MPKYRFEIATYTTVIVAASNETDAENAALNMQEIGVDVGDAKIVDRNEYDETILDSFECDDNYERVETEN